MITRALEILKSKKAAFLDNIKKFNKKCRKLGAAEMIVEFGEERIHTYFINEAAEIMGIKTKVAYQTVNVKYEIPMLKGWELISRFDCEKYMEEDVMKLAVFTNTVPGKELPYEYQDKEEIHCEHCGHNRYRKQSYLVRHEETGEYKEVGSTCLLDFLGHNPNNWLFFSSIETKLREMEDELGSFGPSDPVDWDLVGILTLTNAVIKKYGWVSRSEANEDHATATATADMVDYYLHTPSDKLEPHQRLVIEEVDKEIADKTLEYFLTLENQDNDYIMNCLKLVKINRIPARRLGVACSMIAVYRRYLEKKIESENELPSEWFGNIGSKLQECPVVCTFKSHIETQFGTSVLYKFMDNDGNVFKTFYSGHTWETEQGESLILWGTVKKHDEWNSKKETMLTRCKIAH